MTRIFDDERLTLLQGESLAILRTLPDGFVDTVLTDECFFRLHSRVGVAIGDDQDELTGLCKGQHGLRVPYPVAVVHSLG